MTNPIGWNLRNGAAGTGMAVLASLQLVLTSAGAQPAVAQEREDSTKSLISQGVPVGWEEHRHVFAGKGADALMPVRLRDGMPVPDNSSVNVAQQSETPPPSDASTAAQKLFEEGVQLRNQGTAESLRAAVEKYFQALPLFRAAGDKRGQATTLYNMGVVYQSLGEKQTAVNYYSQALLLYRALGDREEEAGTIYMIGVVYHSLGEKQKALDYYNQVLSLIRALDDRRWEAVTLNNIGAVYESLGEKQKALDYYNQSLPIRRAVGDKHGEAFTLNNIGNVYNSLGEKQKALDYYSQALPLRRAVGDRRWEAVTLNNIGTVYDSLGEKQKALDYYSQALSIIRALGDREGGAATLHNIGKVYESLGEKQKALDYISQALPLIRAVGKREEEATILYHIAHLERDTGNLTQALTQMEASVKIVEDLRSKIANSELRASYFATVQGYYKFYIDLLMRLHKQQPNSGYDAKALHATESARARTLLELLTEAGADIRSGANPQLLQQERTLQQQLDAVEKQRVQLLASNPTQAQVAELEKQRESLLSQYQEVRAQIRVTSPRYAALTQPHPLTLPEIQQQVLDDDTLLLEYSLGEERSYLWAVSKTGISSYELTTRANIEKAAKAFRDAVTSRELASQKQLAARGLLLAEMILKPAKIAGFKRLLIVSDGVLQYTPFAALPASITSDAVIVPLIAQYEIVNLPSASTLAIIRRDTSQRQPAPKTLAVIADPVFGTDDERVRGIVPSGSVPVEAQQLQRSAADAGIAWNRLPFTRAEAQQILSLVPETQRQQAFDFAANRSTATSSELSQYRIVHFATHGFANSEKPELSGVVLSLLDGKGNWQNGYLRLNDIFNLNLPAELVVLSACQTGLGADIKGEGLVGLTRGFMYAGSPRVVVSLWSVNDQGTAELISRFYHKMLKEGKPAAAALREAQLEMWKEKKWKLPYYWAAFMLQGEWR
ncbi:MAG: CHAT domain-containing protein [Oscillatoria princeps RMCB-10]|nr:CHAT domain-containing protein [Oscillatoria princeps RMCB-10]